MRPHNPHSYIVFGGPDRRERTGAIRDALTVVLPQENLAEGFAMGYLAANPKGWAEVYEFFLRQDNGRPDFVKTWPLDDADDRGVDQDQPEQADNPFPELGRDDLAALAAFYVAPSLWWRQNESDDGLIPLDEFLAMVRDGSICDYDGTAEWATETHHDASRLIDLDRPGDPPLWATHVLFSRR